MVLKPLDCNFSVPEAGFVWKDEFRRWESFIFGALVSISDYFVHPLTRKSQFMT
jgi:hypothetical protein